MEWIKSKKTVDEIDQVIRNLNIISGEIQSEKDYDPSEDGEGWFIYERGTNANTIRENYKVWTDIMYGWEDRSRHITLQEAKDLLAELEYKYSSKNNDSVNVSESLLKNKAAVSLDNQPDLPTKELKPCIEYLVAIMIDQGDEINKAAVLDALGQWIDDQLDINSYLP